MIYYRRRAGKMKVSFPEQRSLLGQAEFPDNVIEELVHPCNTNKWAFNIERLTTKQMWLLHAAGFEQYHVHTYVIRGDGRRDDLLDYEKAVEIVASLLYPDGYDQVNQLELVNFIHDILHNNSLGITNVLTLEGEIPEEPLRALMDLGFTIRNI